MLTSWLGKDKIITLIITLRANKIIGNKWAIVKRIIDYYVNIDSIDSNNSNTNIDCTDKNTKKQY